MDIYHNIKLIISKTQYFSFFFKYTPPPIHKL